MKRLNIFYTILFCMMSLSSIESHAQLLNLDSPRIIVYTFEEFTKAFNGKQNEVSVLLKFPKLVNLDRQKFIPLLFSPIDSVPVREIDKFSKYVSQWDYKINMDSVRAIVNLHYNDLKGNKLLIKAEMAQEYRKVGNVWVMKSVEIPDIYLGDTSEIGLISSTSNEVEFQVFGRNAGANPTDIAGINFKPDNVTLFLYLTANKLINFDYSENVRYIFNLGEYRVKVSHVLKKEHPAMGWLITGLMFKGNTIIGNME